jgi:hypothetical protein
MRPSCVWRPHGPPARRLRGRFFNIYSEGRLQKLNDETVRWWLKDVCSRYQQALLFHCGTAKGTAKGQRTLGAVQAGAKADALGALSRKQSGRGERAEEWAKERARARALAAWSRGLRIFRSANWEFADTDASPS